ncbi:MAG: hypothetical protein ACE5GD_00675 [Candidatus Geothermarchaeales archaeon]
MPGLFDSLEIGPLRLRNRIVKPPMETGLTTVRGEGCGRCPRDRHRWDHVLRLCGSGREGRESRVVDSSTYQS